MPVKSGAISAKISSSVANIFPSANCGHEGEDEA
jgi:hypothetical protein